MAILASIAAFLVLLWIGQRHQLSWRYSLLMAAAFWTLYLCVLNESLSLFHILSRGPSLVGWLILCGAGLVLGFAVRPPQPPQANFAPWRLLMENTSRLCRTEAALLSSVAVIVTLVGFTALVSPPNGWDPMQYHLPRIVQWSMHRSVAFFPTHYYVQLIAAPLAEWTMLQFYLLSGGDRFLNLVQWFAFIGSVIGVSLIAKFLGAGRRGQIMAAVFCATLPQSILAASGAKNDLVLAFWMVCSVVFLLAWRENSGWVEAAALGVSLGAAVLTKGSAYAFLPSVALAGWFILSRQVQRRVLRFLPAILLIALLMNATQWVRNVEFAGSPLGSSTADVAGVMKYTVDRITFGGVAAGVLKNTALHCGLPGARFNSLVNRVFRGAVKFIRQNPDDPGSNWVTSSLVTPHYNTVHWGPGEFQIRQVNFNEYYAGNPLHLLLGIFTILVAFSMRKRIPSTIRIYLIGVVVAYIVFCGVLRWQPVGARLHVPLFALLSAPFGVLIVERFPRAAVPTGVILIAASLPFVFFNTSRPLLPRSWFVPGSTSRSSILIEPRDRLYFADEDELADSYIAAAAFVREQHCSRIGLDSSQQLFEYPLFAMIRSPEDPVVTFAGVTNASAKFSSPIDRDPLCLVMCPGCRDSSDKLSNYSRDLPRVTVYGDLVVFSKAVPPASASARTQLR